MNSKPRLIDINLLKKVTQTTHDIKPMIITVILNYIRKIFFNFIINYSDLIIVLLILGFMLYFRYKYNIGIKEKNRKPDILEVNYHRTNDYIDGQLVDSQDTIDIDKNTDENVIDIVTNKVNDFDKDLPPLNINNLNSYANI